MFGSLPWACQASALSVLSSCAVAYCHVVGTALSFEQVIEITVSSLYGTIVVSEKTEVTESASLRVTVSLG